MTLTESALRRSRVTGVLISVLLFAGLLTYSGMPQQMDPGFKVRVVQVVTVFPGASPDRVEQLITDPIEQAVQSVPELDFVTSTSRTGVSIVAVNVGEEYGDLRPIFDNIRRKIDEAKSELPEGIIGPTVNDELGDIYPMLFSMTSDGYSDREVAEIAETIRDQLLHLDGVGKVEILGDQEERVFVEYSDAQLARLGLSPGQLQNILKSRNIIMPGGQIDIGPESIALEPSGNFGSVQELRRALIPLPGGGVAYLGDITAVRRGYIDPPDGMITVSGHPGVTFAVSMRDGNNLTEVGTRVRAFFDDLPARYPHGIDFELTYFQPEEVEAKVAEFTTSVLQAVGIVLVVMLLFLGLRTGVVVSALIPAAMVIVMWPLALIGETINQMTLASLIIALGLLVDNAIVVSESIMVRMSQGEKAFKAAVDACRELAMPLLISSLTTAAAFLPIALAESAVGEYTGALFRVVTATLLVSWGLAMTLTPLLCTLFIKVKRQSSEEFGGAFYGLYRRSLGWVLRWRLITLGIVTVVFVSTMQLFGLIPQIFFPSQDGPFFMAEISLPPGTNMEATKRMTSELDEFLASELTAEPGAEGVTSWTTFIGETPPSFSLGYVSSPSLGGYSELMVHTTSAAVAPSMMDRLRRFAVDRFPDAQTNIRMLSNGPPVVKPIQIRISGSDTDELFELVERVRSKLETIEGTRNIDHNWGARTKKILVTVDEDRARRAGVTNEDVARAMQAFLSGMEVTRYREEDESIPIIVRSVATDRRDLDRVRNLAVFSPSGRSVPLSQVADVSLAWEPNAILRRDRYRTVTVEAGVEEGTTAIEVFEQIEPWLEEQERGWDLGYTWAFGGELESSVKANQSIADKMPIAGLCIILLLVWQFNSLRKPVIVLSTIVLAMIGVVIGLVVMESSFGFMTLLGIISLAGIVINNAIVLLDRVQIEIDDNGLSPYDAIVQAAQTRLRPILLTTATTVASLIPLYISGGEMWKPMSIAIMFGLVFSTMLTLLVVPALYSLFYRVKAPA